MHAMEYYSAIKRNALESILMRWINLEPIIQNKVGQNKKNKYCILMHKHGIYNDDTDDTNCRVAIEMKTWKTDL